MTWANYSVKLSSSWTKELKVWTSFVSGPLKGQKSWKIIFQNAGPNGVKLDRFWYHTTLIHYESWIIVNLKHKNTVNPGYFNYSQIVSYLCSKPQPLPTRNRIAACSTYTLDLYHEPRVVESLSLQLLVGTRSGDNSLWELESLLQRPGDLFCKLVSSSDVWAAWAATCYWMEEQAKTLVSWWITIFSTYKVVLATPLSYTDLTIAAGPQLTSLLSPKLWIFCFCSTISSPISSLLIRFGFVFADTAFVVGAVGLQVHPQVIGREWEGRWMWSSSGQLD